MKAPPSACDRGVVAGDIKPSIIMYDSQSNTSKLTDLGLTRHVDTAPRGRVVPGIPPPTSPERLEGRNVKGHTDLFALGVTLSQLSTGHCPPGVTP
ncbi:MAG: hypothetical protein JXB36_06815 [Gammaproteobacteria bacterium]|nr:hypothetical protein [Gammaproteobacteria bacterium]